MKEKRTITSVEERIRAFFHQTRRMPTYEEMVHLLGVRSKSVVSFWMDKLVRHGILEKDGKGRLSLTRQGLGIPLLGDVAAGFPSPAEEAFRGVVSLDEYLVDRPEASYLLRVSGDSMIGEGIREGDMVIVETVRPPANGDIVVAEVDGEWTMKFFRREGQRVYLEAANPAYPLIEPREALRIGGVVTAVIRKYHV